MMLMVQVATKMVMMIVDADQKLMTQTWLDGDQHATH